MLAIDIFFHMNTNTLGRPHVCELAHGVWRGLTKNVCILVNGDNCWVKNLFICPLKSLVLYSTCWEVLKTNRYNMLSSSGTANMHTMLLSH